MATKEVLLFLIQLVCVMMLKYQKPLAEKIWSGKCLKNSLVLNDCNWCRCNIRHEYTCHARVCAEVDMFGHFNDAVHEINVGMEKRGAWRSTDTACEPGVHYQRTGLLCVCGEDGNWPNPICRDIFRILHSVEVTGDTKPRNQKCSQSKLHLIGCNVCYCPSNGRIDPKLCTKNACEDNDPVLNAEKSETSAIVKEIYAECHHDRKYKLGCKTCTCLSNNRLLCDNCTDVEHKQKKTYCSNKKPGEIFNMECNYCHCDAKGLIYCTAKTCLNGSNTKKLEKLLSLPDTDFKTVERPFEDQDCVPGTKYKKDCNTCYCFNKNYMKIFGCTLNKCPKDEISLMGDCVVDTVYEVDCLICHCEEIHGVKTQFCQVDQRCSEKRASKELRSRDLSDLRGYCEPRHTYQKDCNQCRCNTDGKTIMCTSKICVEPKAPISVGIVPVIQKLGVCPKGHSYKIDCNICFCLSDGNAICSTAECRK